MKNPQTKKYHISIAGNIGSGKTTLTKMISEHYKWYPQYEAVDENPYLFDFYEDMTRWSFNLQIYFLQNRIKQHLFIQKHPTSVVQDRTIYEDAEIFATNLREMNLISARDFENYYGLYETVIHLITPPDILIYLKSSIPTLVDQINKRGRKYEENIRLDYLRRLNGQYESWIERYQRTNKQVIIVDMDNHKPQENKEDLAQIIQSIDTYIGGLF